MLKCGLKETTPGNYSDDVISDAYIWQQQNWKHDDYEHSHARYQLSYVTEGFQYFYIENKVYFVPQNHAIWIPSNIKHRISSSAETVNLTVLLFKYIPQNQFYNSVKIFRVPIVLHEMLNYATKWNKQLIEDDNQKVFLLAILQNLPNFYQKNNALEIPVPSDERLIPICSHINENFRYEFKVEDYVEIANMSVRNLQRIFKNETGITIQKYIQLTRILKSIELIDTKKYTLTEVAFKVGYKSLSAFLTSYKSLMKSAPK
ncbi:helix-turn-helix domain-containing protein [Flavobacterium notoginsengisoli]|uniref:helix-turn-helix domain-containing protein n=1 Tax=Flavobacterium notoginsengisoli TaxID=1478199 RepID=UPI00363CC189